VGVSEDFLKMYLIMSSLIKELRLVIYIWCKLMQHHKKLKDLPTGDLIVEGGEDEESDPNMASNLLNVAGTGNAAFLDELLKAKLDPDIGDSKGRTPLVLFFIC
jgi:hypothetical protein